MTSGKWDGIETKTRPGIYYLLQEAVAAITGGERGIVAIPVFTFTGTAVAGKFYEVESEKDAIDLFGKANVTAITRVLAAGASQALVYAAETPADFVDIRDKYEARLFNVFVYPKEVDAAEQDALVAWTARNRDEGKHFMTVIGGTAEEDQDVAVGNARSIRCKDEYVVNLINGVILGDETEVHSGAYASYLAGLIAGTAINKGLTYTALPVSDVNKRFKNSEIVSALKAGSVVLVNSGANIRIEQAITTSKSESKRGKIRLQSGIQAILTDISTSIAGLYIGKVDNDDAGQTAVINAIKQYLEMLEGQHVLTDPDVILDPSHASEGDSMYLAISYKETDSAEFVYLTINV